jgi:type VI secretion system protein ImpH
LKSDLEQHPERYRFQQAIRLLEHAHRATRTPRKPVGTDAAPVDEVVRFTTHTGFSHPSGEVTAVKADPASGTQSGVPVKVEVSFMGLTGPNGVLPDHYTALLLSRLRANDTALRDFLNLFNHRVISLFYRASEKYRLPLAFERAAADSATDNFTNVLHNLTGLGTPGLRGRTDSDGVALHFAGMFSRDVRPAMALQSILQSYFDLPFHIEQFCGQWLRLDEDQQTRLQCDVSGTGHHNRLGVDTVLGERMRDVQGRFAVVVGPVSKGEFRRFLPNDVVLKKLCQLVRRFVGTEFDFEVQFEMEPKEVPDCTLGGDAATANHLGWNTWLSSQPFTKMVNDAAFSLENV